jgi:peroxiredoxin
MARKQQVLGKSTAKKSALKQAARKPSSGQKARNAAAGPTPGTKAPSFSLPTKEAIDFSRLRADFGRAGTEIVGVSADPVPALAKFKAKHQLAIALASDEKHRMLEDYGVWQEKSLYGRKFLGIVRTTFLIGRDGRPRVSSDGHAAEVLAAAKAL